MEPTISGRLPRRPKRPRQGQKNIPTKGEVFSDIMHELLASIVVVEPSPETQPEPASLAEAAARAATEAASQRARLSVNSPTPGPPQRPDDQFLAHTIVHKFGSLMGAIHKLAKSVGVSLKNAVQMMEKQVVAFVKCTIVDGSHEARLCLERAMYKRMLERLECLRICENSTKIPRANERADKTDYTSNRGKEKGFKKKRKPSGAYPEEPVVKRPTLEGKVKKAEEVVVTESPILNADQPSAKLSPSAQTVQGSAEALLRPIRALLSRCKKKFTPRFFRLPKLFPITIGGARIPPVVGIDPSDDYDFAMAPGAFVYHYKTVPASNGPQNGISLFSCR